jgi:LysR family transcriptional activator of nhaA
VKVKAFNHFLGESSISFLAAPRVAKEFRRGFPGSLSSAPLVLPTHEAAVRREIDHWLESLDINPKRIGEFQDSALMKLVARAGNGIVPVPSVVESELKREYELDTVGRVESVKERFYLISVEKRLKNPFVKEIVERAQRKVFPFA